MVGEAWEGIFFGELQFDGLTGVKRALEETAGQGPGEGACPGLQAPRRGSQRRKSPGRRGQRTGPAPREGGYSWREKRTQGQPRCCHRSGQRGAQKSCGAGHPHPGSPPIPWTPTSRGPCSIISVVKSSLQSCLGRQCCSVRGDSLCPRNLGCGPRSYLSCLLQSLAGPSSTRSMSCKATQKAGRRGPGRRRLTAGPASSRRCTLRTSTSITGTAGRSTGTAHVQGGSRCCIWGLRLFRSIRFHL